MPKIRPATPADAPAIAAVHVAAWRATYTGLMPPDAVEKASLEESTAAWRTVLGLPTGNLTLVADEEGKVVGFATVGSPQHHEDDVPGWAELLSIYVDRPGTGTGGALLDAAEEEMLGRGASTGILWVLEANERARRFYASRGWTADGATRPHEVVGTVLTVVRYVKDLGLRT